jgi:hypothetical protein
MLFDGFLLACCLLVCLVPSTTLPQTISTFFTTSQTPRYIFIAISLSLYLYRYIFIAISLSLNYPIDGVVKKIEIDLFVFVYST